jgi:subtilisin family serine protease
MHRFRRLLGALAAATVAATLSGTAAATPSSPASGPVTGSTAAAVDPAGPVAGPPSSGPADSSTVTLITGDVIRLDTDAAGRQRGSVVRAADPRGGIHMFTRGGDLYAEPAAAWALIASGRLDEQLFNVSGLVRQRYDDRHSRTLPLIITYRGGGSGLAAASAPPGSTRNLVLPSIGGLAVSAEKSRADDFWAAIDAGSTPGSGRTPGLAPELAGRMDTVWLDAQVHGQASSAAPLAAGSTTPAAAEQTPVPPPGPAAGKAADGTTPVSQNMQQIAAPAAWARGLDGAGVTIAVLDTGIDATHPDLAGRLASGQDFTGSGDIIDRAGHGTFVASVAAGTGAASGGEYRGVAPAATLMVGKVLGPDGSGRESWVIAGMQWAASHGADVVSMSLGGPVTQGDDPLSLSLDALSEQYRTLFVVAAGNSSFSQPGTKDVTSPGSARDALTVGAVNGRDFLWSGSRNGLMGDGYVKPDITAPGVTVTAARASGTGWGDSPYTSMTGTSMATPHVAGAAALLLQQHPGWGPDELRAALTSTATPLAGYDVYRVGAGRLDVDRATGQQVGVDSGLLSLGYFARPYDERAMHQTRTLTYANHTGAAVTLRLAATLTDDNGDPAADGALTLSTDSLTIAAGGKEQVDVTLDATAPAPGTYSGRIVAAGPDRTTISTALGFYKQDDTVDVSFRALDRNGDPAVARIRVAPYHSFDGRYYPDNIYLTAAQQEWTLRLPEGDYNVFALIGTLDASGRWISQESIVGNPKLQVHAPNSTVTLDARTAEPLAIDTPKPSTPRYVTLAWSRGDPDSPRATYDWWYWDQEDGEPTAVSVAPTQRVDDAPFAVTTSVDAGVPLLTGRVTGPGGGPLDPVVAGGPYLDGTLHYPLADAGTATPADLTGKDLHGTVALVAESSEISYDQQVQAAADAGAAAVALYSAQPGSFFPVTSGPVPIIALPHDQGERIRNGLAAGRHLQIDLTGTPRSPYAYELTFTEDGQVNPPHYVVRPQDLATVQARVHSPGSPSAGWRLHQSTVDVCQCGPPAVSDFVPDTGYTRTEYVTAGVQDFSAWEFVVDRSILKPRSGIVYRPGQQVTQDWLKAPFSPGVAQAGPDNERLISRRGADWLWYDLAGVTDSAGHWAPALLGLRASSRLYLDGAPIHASEYGLSGQVPVPADAGTYRLVADTSNDGSVIGLSTSTHTEWTFGSAAPASADDTAVLPLLDIDYTDVVRPGSGHSALDLANTAPTGARVALLLRVDHQQGALASPVRDVTVQVSYDEGASWTTASVRNTGDGTFRADYRPPASGQDVSLRVTATDGDGNSIQQTLIRAYLLG